METGIFFQATELLERRPTAFPMLFWLLLAVALTGTDNSTAPA